MMCTRFIQQVNVIYEGWRRRFCVPTLALVECAPKVGTLQKSGEVQ